MNPWRARLLKMESARRQCADFLAALRKYEKPPVSLMFYEGVPKRAVVEYGSGCGSPAQECASRGERI